MQARLAFRRTIAVVILFGLFLLVGQMTYAQSAYPRRQSTYINDYATLLTSQTASNVQALLQDLHRSSGIDAVVVTIQSINSYATGDATIESFATHLFNTWGVGNAQTNRGVLILVAVQDRKVRIELGDGYDASYNGRMQTVIDEKMLPNFRENLYSQGIEQGVRGMIQGVTTATTPLEMLTSRVNPALLVGGLVIGGGLVGYGVLYRIGRRCPQCGQVTLDIQSTTLVSATYHSSGERQVIKNCSNCGYHTAETVTIPRHIRSVSGGHSSGGGGSSSGGGHSSGGGASGSW